MQVERNRHYSVLNVCGIQTTCDFYSHFLEVETKEFGAGGMLCRFGNRRSPCETSKELERKAREPLPSSTDF